jgi:hypothetical protein
MKITHFAFEVLLWSVKSCAVWVAQMFYGPNPRVGEGSTTFVLYRGFLTVYSSSHPLHPYAESRAVHQARMCTVCLSVYTYRYHSFS